MPPTSFVACDSVRLATTSTCPGASMPWQLDSDQMQMHWLEYYEVRPLNAASKERKVDAVLALKHSPRKEMVVPLLFIPLSNQFLSVWQPLTADDNACNYLLGLGPKRK
eukprot:4694077-Amphidinium_carterae.1